MKKALKKADRGAVFRYAGWEWVVLEHDPSGRTLCLTKGIVESRAFDDDNCNNFATASSNKYLNGAFLDNLIESAPSPHAFRTTELDLTADDGLKDYGTCTVTIFLLTVDQYRRNRDIIPNADDWWWLSTAYSTAANGYEHSARYVYSDGSLLWYGAYYGHHGLRPACYLDSELLISVPDEYITAEQAGGIAKELVEQYDGSYATEAQFRAELAFMLGKLRAQKEAAHE